MVHRKIILILLVLLMTLIPVYGVDLTATVENSLPAADAGGPYTVLRQKSITLDGSGSKHIDGTIESYLWDFGDGSLGTGIKPTHLYNSIGTYVITLTVVDNDDLIDTDTAIIKVTEPPSPPPSGGGGTPSNRRPVANAGEDQTVYVNETVMFSALESYDFDDFIDIYVWDFGDGEVAIVAEVSHVYSEVDNYTVSLTVTDSRGDEGKDTCIVTVIEVPPIITSPDFIVSNLAITPREVEPGDEVTITFTVTNIGVETGTYTVTLTVEDEPTILEVTLIGGESDVLVFKVTPEAEGTYKVDVDTLNGTFTVKVPPKPLKPAEFVLSNFNYTSEIQVGEPLSIYIDITNIGELPGETTIIIEIDGIIHSDLQSLFQLEPEYMHHQVWTSLYPHDIGTHTIQLDGFEGTFTVVAGPVPLWRQWIFILFILVLLTGITIAWYIYQWYLKTYPEWPPKDFATDPTQNYL